MQLFRSQGLTTLLLLAMLLGLNSNLMAASTSTLDKIIERGTLILGTSGNMPSMSQLDDKGDITGFDIDVARVMANLLGVKLEARVFEFAELISALEEGKVDVVISNMTITPQRNLKVAFVGPYMRSGKCFVTRNRDLASGEGAKDLNVPETRLAVLADSTSEKFARALLPQATLITVGDFKKAAELVKSDQANGLLTDYPVCLAILKDNPEAGFVSVFSLLTYEPIGIALPAGDAQFINWTENFLDRMDGTNGLEEFARRWFGKVELVR